MNRQSHAQEIHQRAVAWGMELLKLAALSPRPDGYDAVDDDYSRYLIKGRTVASLDKATSFDLSSDAPKFDYLLCVFLQKDTFARLGMLKLSYADAKALWHPNQDTYRVRYTRERVKDPRF